MTTNRKPRLGKRRALELLAAGGRRCREAILLAHSSVIDLLQKRTTQFVLLFFGLPTLVFLVLALAQADISFRAPRGSHVDARL
jgi:hypothetical protein